MKDWQQGDWLVRSGVIGDDQPVVMVISVKSGDTVSLPINQVRAIAGAILDAAATLAGELVTPAMFCPRGHQVEPAHEYAGAVYHNCEVCGVTYRQRDCTEGGTK